MTGYKFSMGGGSSAARAARAVPDWLPLWPIGDEPYHGLSEWENALPDFAITSPPFDDALLGSGFARLFETQSLYGTIIKPSERSNGPSTYRIYKDIGTPSGVIYRKSDAYTYEGLDGANYWRAIFISKADAPALASASEHGHETNIVYDDEAIDFIKKYVGLSRPGIIRTTTGMNVWMVHKYVGAAMQQQIARQSGGIGSAFSRFGLRVSSTLSYPNTFSTGGPQFENIVIGIAGDQMVLSYDEFVLTAFAAVPSPWLYKEDGIKILNVAPWGNSYITTTYPSSPATHRQAWYKEFLIVFPETWKSVHERS